MARITIEKKIPVGDGVYEVKQTEYILPNNITYKGEYMSYDSHHQGYLSMHKDSFVSATEYVKYVLSKSKENSDKDANRDGKTF